MASRKDGMPDVRLTRRQTERHRLAIKTSQIISRLQRHIDNELEMSASQIAASKVLLDKILPNLTSQDLRILEDLDSVPGKADIDAIKKQLDEQRRFQKQIVQAIGQDEFARVQDEWKETGNVQNVKLLTSAGTA